MTEKITWTDSDFEVMGWHDAQLYSMTFPIEDFIIKFDIDYIFKWHRQGSDYLGWDVAPCDLIFQNVLQLRVDIDMGISIPLCIQDVRRRNSRLSPSGTVTLWDYEIELDHGRIAFEATGYKQTLRRQPVFSTTQNLVDRE